MSRRSPNRLTGGLEDITPMALKHWAKAFPNVDPDQHEVTHKIMWMSSLLDDEHFCHMARWFAIEAERIRIGKA